MGMIADIINICQAKHLLCKPFPIDYRQAMKSIPVIGGHNSASHSVKIHEVSKALGLLEAYFCLQGGRLPYPSPCTPEHGSGPLDHTAKEGLFWILLGIIHKISGTY
jgi:hypothetical protein